MTSRPETSVIHLVTVEAAHVSAHRVAELITAAAVKSQPHIAAGYRHQRAHLLTLCKRPHHSGTEVPARVQSGQQQLVVTQAHLVVAVVSFLRSMLGGDCPQHLVAGEFRSDVVVDVKWKS